MELRCLVCCVCVCALRRTNSRATRVFAGVCALIDEREVAYLRLRAPPQGYAERPTRRLLPYERAPRRHSWVHFVRSGVLVHRYVHADFLLQIYFLRQ